MRTVFKGTFYATRATEEHGYPARPARVELDFAQVSAALQAGTARVGGKVTVSVKVGKRRRLYKAVLCEQVDRCCGDCDRGGAVYGYCAERG